MYKYLEATGRDLIKSPKKTHHQKREAFYKLLAWFHTFTCPMHRAVAKPWDFTPLQSFDAWSLLPIYTEKLTPTNKAGLPSLFKRGAGGGGS